MPHAVIEVDRSAGADEFAYDAMGNMTSRDESGTSWVQPFNAEGRLESVTDSGTSDAWDFVYNGDGVRVRQENPDGTTTLFIAGGSYEVVIDAQGAEASIRKYYAIGGQRIMRENDTNYYLLTDHLESVVGIADESGGLISQQRYLPYGIPRLTPGIDETDYGYTGQRDLKSVRLMDYDARWYSQGIGRFISSDPQGLSSPRSSQAGGYRYAAGNPTRFSDPTGGYADEGCGIPGPHKCDPPKPQNTPPPPQPTEPPGGDAGDSSAGEEDDVDEITGSEVILSADYWSLAVFTDIPFEFLADAYFLGGLLDPAPLEEPTSIPAVLLSKWFSAGVTISWDRSGSIYISPGIAVARNLASPVSLTLHGGVLDPGGVFGPGMASPEQVKDFLGGGLSVSHGLSGPFFPSVSRVWIPNSKARAWEFGFGTPQINPITVNITAITIDPLR